MDSNKLIDDKTYDYESLLQSGKPSDVVLVAGGKQIRAHKVVLSARSPVFAAMFANSSTKEAQENRVEITDLDVEVVKLLVRYIYTGKVDMLDRYADDLFVAADKYLVDSLKSLCEDQLVTQISVKTVSDLFLFADMYQITELNTECIQYIINNGVRVMASKGWNKIVTRDDLIAKLCEGLLVKLSELNFSDHNNLASITTESVSDKLFESLILKYNHIFDE